MKFLGTAWICFVLSKTHHAAWILFTAKFHYISIISAILIRWHHNTSFTTPNRAVWGTTLTCVSLSRLSLRDMYWLKDSPNQMFPYFLVVDVAFIWLPYSHDYWNPDLHYDTKKNRSIKLMFTKIVVFIVTKFGLPTTTLVFILVSFKQFSLLIFTGRFFKLFFLLWMWCHLICLAFSFSLTLTAT